MILSNIILCIVNINIITVYVAKQKNSLVKHFKSCFVYTVALAHIKFFTYL